jgi:hypothetical protein
MYAIIEWRSHRYPHKRYEAIIFTEVMAASFYELVMTIPDYHTVIMTQAHLVGA